MSLGSDIRLSSEEYLKKVSPNNGFSTDTDNLKLGFVKDTNYYDKDLNNYNFAKIEEILSTLDSKNNPIRAALIDSLHPVGSIYITATNTNPSSFLGGTWKQIAAGKCLFGVRDGLLYNSKAIVKEGDNETGHVYPHVHTHEVSPKGHAHSLPKVMTSQISRTLHNDKNPVVQLDKAQANIKDNQKIVIGQVPVRINAIEATPTKKEEAQWKKDEKTKPVKHKGVIWIPYLDSNINWGANILNITDNHAHTVEYADGRGTYDTILNTKDNSGFDPAEVSVMDFLDNKDWFTGNLPPFYGVYFWERTA